MCGFIGVVNQERKAAYDLYYGLLALQHRGKECAGMTVTSPSGEFQFQGGMGELPQAFWLPQVKDNHGPAGALVPRSIGSIEGSVGIGHVRYGTAGEADSANIQPISGVFRGRTFSIAHNGNLVNVSELSRQTNRPTGCSDTRVIAELIANSPAAEFEDALVETANKLRGAFSLVALYGEKLYALRDPFGFHPLQIGWRQGDWFVVSESCALDMVGATLVRDLWPGELFIVERKGEKRWRQWTDRITFKFDIFEFIYFLRPDSIVHGVEAGDARCRMGQSLAWEHPLDGDVVIPVPDSGNEAARGYWQGMREQGHTNLDFHPWAPFRPHVVSRTFIEPVQEKRREYLGLKFNPRPTQLSGKRVILVDDSRVRGNTTGVVAGLLRKAGVREIAMVVSSPPYLYPDFYGIDTYRILAELEARNLKGDIQAMAKKHGLNYLGYLSLEKTISAVLNAQPGSPGLAQGLPPDVRLSRNSFYTGPFTGVYPAGTGDFTVT